MHFCHEQILFLNSKDLLVLFSFPPYSKETVHLASFAQERKIDVFSVTNKPASPITFYTKADLVVESKNMLFTNSFAAISVLINAIATSCAVKNKARAKKILKESEEIAVKIRQLAGAEMKNFILLIIFLLLLFLCRNNR